MSTTLTQTLFALPVAERVALADELYASVPSDWQMEVDDAWLTEATLRADEMEGQTCDNIPTKSEFLAGL